MKIDGLTRAFLFASALVAGQAHAQQLIPVAPAATGPDGVTVISPLDNPVFSGSYTLGTTPRTQMEATSNGNAWLFRGFGLWNQLQCAAGDTVCTPSGGTRLTIGLLQAGTFPIGSAIPIQVHGTRLGNASATVQLFQEQDAPVADDPPVPSLATSIVAKLLPGTIVVPVNVVVVLPAGTMPNERSIMLPIADPAVAGTLFDDLWGSSTFRFPSAILENEGFFTTMSAPRPGGTPAERIVDLITNNDGNFSTRVAPVGILVDQVFAQCGIQFRMVDFVVVEESNPRYVRRIVENGPGPGDDTAFCGGGGPFGGGPAGELIRHLKDAAAPQLRDPALTTVIFNYLVDTPSCLTSSGLCCADHTLGAHLSGDVVVSVLDMAGSNHQLTLAHELGHALGLDHTPCKTPEVHNLMCDDAIDVEFHIPGCEVRNGETVSPTPYNCVPRANESDQLSLASCSIARATATGRQPDTTPPLVDAGPDQTLECTSPDGAPVTLSGTASDPESGISNSGWFQENHNLGSGPTATTTAPIGVTTYRKFALNGKSLSAEDTVSVTVRDTQPPVLSGPATVNVTGCESGGTIALAAPTATDACSTGLTVTGAVVESDGNALPTPIVITNGGVVLQPGTHVVEWRAVDPAGNVGTLRQTVQVAACFASGESMSMSDRSRLSTAAGHPVQIVNYGTGSTEVGVDARLGGIISRGPVVVRDRAVVAGPIRSGATVTRSGANTITGTIIEHASIVLPPAPTITNPWPGSDSGPVSLEPGTQRSLTPGSYGALSVKRAATLSLAAGTYFFTTVTLEPDSAVTLAGVTTIEVRDALTLRGIFRDAGGAMAPISLRYRGTAAVAMETSFFGTVLAPSATLTLGGGTPTMRGQFFARRLEIRPDVAVVATAAPAPGPPSRSTDSEPVNAGGCGCQLPAGQPGAGIALLAVALGVALRRRRPSHRA